MQAYDVSFNMVILMLSLDIDFGIFDDLGNSNLNVGFRGNLEEIMKQNHWKRDLKFQHHIFLSFVQNGSKSGHQALLRWNWHCEDI